MLSIQKILESLNVFDPLIQQVRDALQGITVNDNVGHIISDIIQVNTYWGSAPKQIILYSETAYPVIDLISVYVVPTLIFDGNLVVITNVMTDVINEMEGLLYKTTMSLVVNLENFTVGTEAPQYPDVHIKYIAQY